MRSIPLDRLVMRFNYGVNMNKKETKEALIKVQVLLRSGILQAKKEQIIEAYALLESLLAKGYGVFCLNGTPKFPIDADTARIDWLASTEQNIGQVLLPKGCVENNLIDGLRGAIDCAMKLDA